jgi:hypothetical protein
MTVVFRGKKCYNVFSFRNHKIWDQEFTKYSRAYRLIDHLQRQYQLGDHKKLDISCLHSDSYNNFNQEKPNLGPTP